MLLTTNFVMDNYSPGAVTYAGLIGEQFATFGASLPDLSTKVHFENFSIDYFEITYLSHYSPYMQGLKYTASDWVLAGSLDFTSPSNPSIRIDGHGANYTCLNQINACFVDETNGYNQNFVDHAHSLFNGGVYFKMIPIFDSLTETNYNYEGTVFNFGFSANITPLSITPVTESATGLLLSVAILFVFFRNRLIKSGIKRLPKCKQHR